MAIGTAGFTAMLAVIALEQHGLKPDAGEVLVTGAAGGVGSVAVALPGQARLPGRRLDRPAETARLSERPRRRRPRSIAPRSPTTPARPLDRERWAGAIDAVGGDTLGDAS